MSVIEKDFVAEIETKIDKAYALADSNDVNGAIEVFDEIRNFADTEELRGRVDKFETDFRTGVEKEREQYRSYVKQGNPVDPERRIVVLADSLGLPRPGEPNNVIDNQPTSYSFALREATKRRHSKENAPKTAIDPVCQRYATSTTVLANMDLVDLDGADVVIHVGLNDFSRRIFMERQRLALKLLPQPLVNKIVRFGQANMYRAEIIERFDEHCYVTLEQWKDNIEAIANTARTRGARSLTWLTIMQLPMRVESHTPHYRHNVVRYNLALYDARRNKLLDLLDVDRMFWELGFTEHMHEDLMHLSPKGNICVCNRLIERYFDLESYTVKE